MIAGIFRGVFALHIIWQFWMGLYYWEYRQAKFEHDARAAKKNLLVSLGVPFLIHGTNDFLAFVSEDKYAGRGKDILENASETGTISPEMNAFVFWLLALIVFMAFEIFFLINTSKKARTAAKESRLAENPEEDGISSEAADKESKGCDTL